MFISTHHSHLPNYPYPSPPIYNGPSPSNPVFGGSHNSYTLLYVHTQTQPAVVASAYSLAPKLQFIHPAGFLTACVTLGRYLSVCLAAAPSLSGVGISRIVISMLEEKIYRLVLLHGLSLNTAETNKCLCKSGLSYLK